MTAFGDALLRTWGGTGRKRSYTATGWHAQIAKLTESQRGYDAMAAAGIDVTPRTLLSWLSQGGGREDFAPSAANRSRIQKAYDALAGGRWNTAHQRDYLISGLVKLGHDERERGGRGPGGRLTAPLKVAGTSGDWKPIADAWNAGTLTSQNAEELYIQHVINRDPALMHTSDPWEFPGSQYTIN